MTHIKPLKELVEPGWAQALAGVEPQVHRMGDFLRSEIAAGRTYLPASRNILRAFTIPFDSIKVLIVGQDPYPTPGHPVGLSFCVAPNIRPIPRSLANIYTELTDDLGVPMPDRRTGQTRKPPRQRLGGNHRRGHQRVEQSPGLQWSYQTTGSHPMGAQSTDAGTTVDQRFHYQIPPS